MINTSKGNFFAAIEEVALSNNLTSQEIDEIFEEAIIKSFHSKFDPDAELELLIDRKNHKVKLINHSKIVIDEDEDKLNNEVEISLKNAKKINRSIKEGELISEEVSFELYSRIATQQIKQLLIQRIQQIRKMNIYEKYKGLVGTLVEAVVTSASTMFAILVLEDGTPLFMPDKFKNPNIPLKIGSKVKVFVEEVLEESRGAQIIVSNASPTLVKKVLEEEVPEIMDGIIEIKSMARIVGERTKIAVASSNDNVDPVGAIIGARGERITRIVERLNNEKIDVIKYSEDINEFVAAAISPAKAVAILNKDGEEDKKIVIVPNKHQTLAIGRSGSNAKLVAKLARVRIDVISIDQAKEDGIEFTFNGNLNQQELDLIESGQKLVKNKKNTNNNYNHNFNSLRSINIDDIDQDIESFNNEVEDSSFVFLEDEKPIFTDDELRAMESEFELDNELVDFADVDLSSLDNFNEE